MADQEINPANEQWITVTNAVTEIKTLVKGFQSANDEEKALRKGIGENVVKLETMTKALEEKFIAIEARLSRNKGFHAANEELAKGLGDFNACRITHKRKEFSENEAQDYNEVYAKFLRVGCEVHRLEAGELKTLEEGRDPSGGYWVMPQMSARVIEKEFETSPMEDVATVETTMSDRFGYFIDFDEFEAEYTRELKARDITDTAKIGKLYIDIFTTYAKIPTSTEILEDASINITNWLTRKINRKITRIRNNNYINGSGDGQEFGILSPATPAGGGGAGTESGVGVFGQVQRVYTTNAFGSGTTVLDFNDFLRLFAQLKNAYHSNATILMSRQCRH